ncbi:MAG TPA: hypothetical protein VLA66_08440 [Thermoanaerobaculia bacterium]|nr:hypothetical protein [Thermoanaerobaculia bacterium]
MKRWLGAALVLAALGTGAALVLAWLESPPSGPVEPVWDRQACAYCSMHLGERGFAAQLQTDDGEVLFFDDPGCLLLWRSEHPDRQGAAYFHAHDAELWLPESGTGFVRVEISPMGWGFAAVEAGTPGATSVAEVEASLFNGASRAPR